MIVKFEKQYLEQLYQTGKCGDKKHRFQPQIIKNYHKCVDVLMAAPQIEKLFTFPSLRYEVLSGDKKGISSIRINDQYRLEFRVEVVSEEPIVIICHLEDITNHYKK